MKKLFSLLAFTFLFTAITNFTYSQTTRILAETFNTNPFPPSGWLLTNAGSGNNWARATGTTYEGNGCMRYSYNGTYAANTWAFTYNLALTAGNSYYVVFYERVGLASYQENLKITVGQGQTVAQQTTTIGNYAGLTNTAYARQQTSGFIPQTSGNYNFAFNCYSAANQYTLSVDSVNIYQVAASNMSFVSSTTTQTLISPVPAGGNNQLLIGIQIVTSGALSPFSLSEFDLNTNGSSNAASDITKARMYSTGTSSAFSTDVQFGSDLNNPNGAFEITGSQQLLQGTNYFWLVYDINSTATAGNYVDAECNQLTMDGGIGIKIPTIQAPPGNRTIVSPLSGSIYVGLGQAYTTLTGPGGMFDAINNSGLSGNVTAIITSDITEPGSIQLNQWAESGVGGYILYICPQDQTIKTISGNCASGMITFNGADRVTIDGSFGFSVSPGGSKYLTFRNTNAGNPVFSFINDAANNLLTNLVIEGQNSNSASGTIFFGTTTGTTGNDYNSITYCNIGDRSDAYGTPANAIYSAGSTGTTSQANSQITISNNNIYNFYGNGLGCSGVYASTGSTDWTITNNCFYQTDIRNNTVASGWSVIFINSSGSNNNLISGNKIGGSGPNCSGSWAVASSSGSTFLYPIRTFMGTATASVISDNTIRSISMVTTITSGVNVFTAIFHSAGLVSSISGNMIGDTTGNSNLNFTINGGAYGSNIIGIQCAGTASNILNNNFGSCSFGGTTTTAVVAFGILVSGTPSTNCTISGNKIGSIGTAGSFQNLSAAQPSVFSCINSQYASATVNVTNNIISNVLDISTTSASGVFGIQASGSGIMNITGNTINELSTLSINTSTSPGSNAATGITITSTATGQIISQNIISGIRSATTASVSTSVTGISISQGGTSPLSTINANRLYDLTNQSTGGSGSIWGMFNFYGSWVVTNNQISLTNGELSDHTGKLKTSKIKSTRDKSMILETSHSTSENSAISQILSSNSGNNNSNNLYSGREAVQNIIQSSTNEDAKLRISEKEERCLIRKKNSKDGALSVNGINIEGIRDYADGTGKFYYNSIYIGGGISTGTAPSRGFYKYTGSSTTVIIKNNILYMSRSGGSGPDYAISNGPGSGTGFTSNYNVLVSSSPATIGEYGALVNKDFASWISATSGDKQSWSVTSLEFNANNLFNSIVDGDLGIQTGNPEAWLVSGKGIAINTLNSDFLGNSRVISVSGGATDIGSAEFSDTPPGNPPATVNGTIAGDSTTTYTLWGRTLAIIKWGPGGTYPSGMTVNYYSGVSPSNVLGGHYSNSHTTFVPSGNPLSGASYDITYYFQDNETYTISSPVTNTILSKYNGTNWEIYQPGSGVNQTQLIYNAGTANYSAKVTGLTGFSDFALTDLTSALPVQLCSFTASAVNRDITLSWTTCREINNSGFDIERRVLTDPKTNTFGNWVLAGHLKGHGTTNQPQSYSFKEEKLNCGKFQFRLRQIDYNSNFEYFNLNNSDFVEIGKPATADVSQNYPNPSNPNSRIDYQIPFNGKISIRVYDIIGREVAILVNEIKEAGFYTAEFDGTNVASGIYFYRIIAEGDGQKFTQTRKLVLVK